MRGFKLAFLAAALAALASGCALTGKSDPVVFRYFTPQRPTPPRSGALGRAASHDAPALELRLGRVNAATHLKDRIVFRDSAHELNFYDDLRWTEKPESYLRRAASRSLFEEHGIRQTISGSSPTLDVELSAFEELRAPRHAARVELTWTLRDDQAVILQRSLTVERPIAPAKPEARASAVAAAMAEALGEAVEAIVVGVLVELQRDAATRAPAAAELAPSR